MTIRAVRLSEYPCAVAGIREGRIRWGGSDPVPAAAHAAPPAAPPAPGPRSSAHPTPSRRGAARTGPGAAPGTRSGRPPGDERAVAQPHLIAAARRRGLQEQLGAVAQPMTALGGLRAKGARLDRLQAHLLEQAGG